MCKKLICLIACAALFSAASGVQAAVLKITPTAPVPGDLDIANFVGCLTDADNVGTEDDSNNPPYWNDWCTYVAHDRGGQGQTFLTGDEDALVTGVWVKHVTYSGADPDQTWYRMQPGAELEIRITDPAAAGTDAFVLASEIYVVTGEEENALPADTANDQTGTSLWFHITLDAPVALAANTLYGFDLTSLSGKAGIMFFETDGINDRAEGGNPYEAGTAYTSGVNPDDHGDDLNGANDNNMVIAPGDHVFVVELESAAAPAPVHSYTFEEGTANDSVGSAHGTLIGDAAVVGGSLVLDGDGDWMEMPGDVIAMNTYSEVTVETWFTSVEGGNTGFHMLAAFGEEGTGAADWAGYRYLFITPARGDDVSRAAIQTSSMDDSPWDEETGVSATVEHDDGLEHHFVATVDATNITFYIDGALIGSEPLAPGNEIAGISQAVAYLGKGVYPVDPLWAGSVEELSIYSRALTLAEVEARYRAGPQKVGPTPVDPGTEGLVLHLPLDTASRGKTQDSSENGLDGTLFGDPTFAEGVDIMAMEFDGVDDRVEIADDPAFDTMSEKFTIAAWIKLGVEGTTDRRPIISKELEPDPDGRGWEFKVNNGQLAMQLYSPVEGEGKLTITGATALDADQWYHVAGIYQADGLEQFYVNGQLDHEQELVTALQSNDSPANIGAYIWSPTGYQKYFAGLIDEVRIYDRALSAKEVSFLAGM